MRQNSVGSAELRFVKLADDAHALVHEINRQRIALHQVYELLHGVAVHLNHRPQTSWRNIHSSLLHVGDRGTCDSEAHSRVLQGELPRMAHVAENDGFTADSL